MTFTTMPVFMSMLTDVLHIVNHLCCKRSPWQAEVGVQVGDESRSVGQNKVSCLSSPVHIRRLELMHILSKQILQEGGELLGKVVNHDNFLRIYHELKENNAIIVHLLEGAKVGFVLGFVCLNV